MNIAEAKAKLSALVEKAVAGEEVILAKAGKPVARIVPLPSREPRKPGLWKHFLGRPLTEAENAALIAPMSDEEIAEMEAEWDEFYGPKPNADR
jgi:prevent-host-death family protein